jgi:uncharacterized membrane protein
MSKTPLTLITPCHATCSWGKPPRPQWFLCASVVHFFRNYRQNTLTASVSLRKQKKLSHILPTMKKLILCTVLLGLTSCVPANSSNNNNNNQLVSDNHTTDNQEFRVFGTEPFWSVEVRPSGIVYNSLATEEKQTFPYVTPLAANGRLPETVRVYRLGQQNNTLLIIRKVDNCSDGMSDNLYPYSGLFIQGNMVLEGCADKLANFPQNPS